MNHVVSELLCCSMTLACWSRDRNVDRFFIDGLYGAVFVVTSTLNHDLPVRYAIQDRFVLIRSDRNDREVDFSFHGFNVDCVGHSLLQA